MRIEITTTSKRDRINQQTLLFYSMHNKAHTRPIKVLSYMIRHNTDGMFILRPNYVKDIAQLLDCSRGCINQTIQKLVRDNIIVFVSAGKSNNKGSYRFAPLFESLCSHPEKIVFDFVRNPVNKL